MLNDLFQTRVPQTLAVVGLGLGAVVGAAGVHNGPTTTPQAGCSHVMMAVAPQHHESGLWARADCF